MAAQDIKAIIIDCFGVLYIDAKASLFDIFPEYKDEIRDLRRQADYGYLSRDEFIESVVGLTQASADEIRRYILDEHVLNRRLVEYLTKEIKPYYKIGLLSNIGRGWIENFFTQNQLHDFFDAVVLSGDEGVTKPHPQIYELMAERLGVEMHECVMIDDLPENSAGADAAGMKGVVYATVHDVKQELAKLLK